MLQRKRNDLGPLPLTVPSRSPPVGYRPAQLPYCPEIPSPHYLDKSPPQNDEGRGEVLHHDDGITLVKVVHAGRVRGGVSGRFNQALDLDAGTVLGLWG